jgi:hypothetical protein
MRTEAGAWPILRPGWKGHIPKIFSGQSTDKIFHLACRPHGATINEMLKLRRDTGNDYPSKVAALLKLLNEIESAYLVKLVVNGDNYHYQRIS